MAKSKKTFSFKSMFSTKIRLEGRSASFPYEMSCGSEERSEVDSSSLTSEIRPFKFLLFPSLTSVQPAVLGLSPCQKSIPKIMSPSFKSLSSTTSQPLNPSPSIPALPSLCPDNKQSVELTRPHAVEFIDPSQKSLACSWSLILHPRPGIMLSSTLLPFVNLSGLIACSSKSPAAPRGGCLDCEYNFLPSSRCLTALTMEITSISPSGTLNAGLGTSSPS
mmetsp:Transcript_26594/g.48262  ORF Transcript_26594/g.48262 Transcript_26594/m.48262 type:complete len:220 (-) Transcript_26594:1464-2123(-)